MSTNNAVNSPLSGTTGTGNFVGSTSPTLVTPALGTPSALDLTNASGLPASALPAGTMFNFQQGQLTTATSITPAGSWTDTTLSVAITPTSSSNNVLVRAVMMFSLTDANNLPFFRLVRGSTPIGIGTSVGSRTACGTSFYEAVANTSNCQQVILEWLDSPATTSATTYKLQGFAGTATTNTGISINNTVTDTNSSNFPRGVSVISVCEVHA